MTIHAPAHRPAHQPFHFTLPHLSDAASGVLTALAALVVIVIIGAGISLVIGPPKPVSIDQLAPYAPFRASEHQSYVPADAQQMMQFRLEEHGY